MLIFFIASAELVGAISGFFTAGSVSSWYATLAKPFFSPPNWLFGPVWIALYACMGIAAWMVWSAARDEKRAQVALRLYWAQLLFNFMWSIFFFGQRSVVLGLIDILLLLALIILTTVDFFRIRRGAGWLFIPYVAWVAFATALNIALFVLN
jgi:tryptophan-rich sensory protein